MTQYIPWHQWYLCSFNLIHKGTSENHTRFGYVIQICCSQNDSFCSPTDSMTCSSMSVGWRQILSSVFLNAAQTRALLLLFLIYREVQDKLAGSAEA